MRTAQVRVDPTDAPTANPLLEPLKPTGPHGRAPTPRPPQTRSVCNEPTLSITESVTRSVCNEPTLSCLLFYQP
eukprot:1187335-Prorocentrum_minimum.AAC.1